MSDQKLVLDLSGLAVESVEVVPADSLESATYGHGMSELAASSSGTTLLDFCSCFKPDDPEDA
jgi:hypothetical protein